MYYVLIMISVIMFGGCFALNDAYRKIRGSSLKTSLQFSFIGSLSSVIVLLIINGFKFEFTIFTLIMAVLASISGFAFTYCSFKALGSINLSLYSLFYSCFLWSVCADYRFLKVVKMNKTFRSFGFIIILHNFCHLKIQELFLPQ